SRRPVPGLLADVDVVGAVGSRRASCYRHPAGSVAIMAVTTRFTELTGCRVPVQQAPMGSVSTAALAVAVAEAGGVGSITALGMTAAELDKVLAGMAAQTAGVLAANFL